MKRYVFFICIFTIILTSCKKDVALNKNSQNLVSTNSSNVTMEKVDTSLINKYVSYQSALEATKMLAKNGIVSVANVPKMNQEEFKKMIDNYLANERNIHRVNLKISQIHKGSNSEQEDPPDGSDCVDCENNAQAAGGGPSAEDTNSQGDPSNNTTTDDNSNVTTNPSNTVGNDYGSGIVNCDGTVTNAANTGAATASTITGIHFSATMSGTTIATDQISFQGITWSMAPVSPLNQSVSQGVTTFQQYYSASVTANTSGSISGEVINGSISTTETYSQLFVVYGNIYNGACTVHAMRIIAIP